MTMHSIVLTSRAPSKQVGSARSADFSFSSDTVIVHVVLFYPHWCSSIIRARSVI